jgi:hypothetical protein
MKEDDVYFDLLNLLKLVDFGVGPPPPSPAIAAWVREGPGKTFQGG